MFQTIQLSFLFLFLLFSCARVPVKTELSSSQSSGVTAKGVGDPETAAAQKRAETFDKFVWGKLSPADVVALKDSCQKNTEKNIFCYGVQNEAQIQRRVKTRTLPPHRFEPHPIVPLAPTYDRNRVTNWKELRNGPVKRLLKGLEGFSLAQLRVLAKLALKEKHCPNSISIVVAATLEDYLPDQVGVEEIAQLYEKGAVCTHRSPIDRENYLTRAGLLYFLKKDYKKAAALFHRSGTITESFSGRALYWLARCRDAMGDKSGAKASFDQLFAKYPFTFHTLVGSVAGGRDPGGLMFKSQLSTEKRSKRVPALNPLIAEAEELHRFGFDDSAAAIVDWAFDLAGRAEPDVRLHLAELGDDRTKVLVTGDLLNHSPSLISRQSLELYFPKAFYPLFEKDALDLSPFLLMSVARQESTFNPKAISPANAQGLLQIHPDTAVKINGTPVDLMDPDKNISLAARYLTDLISRLNGKIFLALAAYNAGEEKVAMWQHRYPIEDPVLFIDLISYKETRTYVAAVLRNYFWYRRIFQDSDKQALTQVFDPRVAREGSPAAAPVPTPSLTPTPVPTAPSSTPAPSPTPPPLAPASPAPQGKPTAAPTALPEIPSEMPGKK